MNENNITVVAKPAQKQDEIELDLRDLLANLLLKWKTILAVLLIGAILGFGVAQMKSGKETEPVSEEAIATAREKLASDKATMVEQLFFQYVGYKELQEDIRAYYRTFAASDVNLDNTIQMRKRIYVTSKLENLHRLMMLTEEDYQAMRDIAPDEKAGATIYDRVKATVDSEETIAVLNLEGQDRVPTQYVLNIELYGNSEEQCKEMMAIVEKAVYREIESLKELDPGIEATTVKESFNYNVAEYVQDLRKKNIDKMTTSETELSRLEAKVEKLASDEKSYYNLLKNQYDEAFAVEDQHVSWKKWTVIGAFLGAVIAAGLILLGYVLDGKVKSPCELEQDGNLLNRVFIKGKKNLFGKWAAGLIHANETDPAVKADMVATDISIMMEKNGKHSLMLLCSGDDADAAGFAEQVKARLLGKNGDLKISIGNPTCSVEELEMAAEADMGVAFAEMKKSKRAMLREWRQICARYKLPLAGSVSVQRCWNS